MNKFLTWDFRKVYILTSLVSTVEEKVSIVMGIANVSVINRDIRSIESCIFSFSFQTRISIGFYAIVVQPDIMFLS